MDNSVSIGKLTMPEVFRDVASCKIKPCEMKYVVLVATGSYNPPTYMHFRMFELARDALLSEGYFVIGGYMSPVNDAYKKKGLVSAKHRLQMCELASQTSDFVMIDPWEANQSSYQRTITVLSRVRSSLTQGERQRYAGGSLKVMLVCGSDLLESFGVPGLWIPEQIQTICRDYGVVCIRREGQDIERIICNNAVLNELKQNIKTVDDLIPNQISSSRVRRKPSHIIKADDTTKMRDKGTRSIRGKPEIVIRHPNRNITIRIPKFLALADNSIVPRTWSEKPKDPHLYWPPGSSGESAYLRT